MATLNILYIAPSVGVGGVETFLKHVSQGHSSTCNPIFLLFQQGPLGQWLESKNATVFYCQHKPRISRPWTWVLFQLELFKLVKTHAIQIVHASMSYSALFAWPSFFYSKFIWFQHGPVSGWMDRIGFAFPHHAIIYNSQHTLQQQLAINGNGIPRINDFTMHLGTPSVDIRLRNTSKKNFINRYGLSDNTCIITMACRLQRWKGVHVAIDAIKKFAAIDHPPIALFIFGDEKWDIEYAKELQQMSQGLPVFINTPIEDLTPIYLASDIVLNCSTTAEPFGLTLIEAMSCGAIPIAPRHGGPIEILSPELEDCLFEPKSSSELFNLLTVFIKNDQKLRQGQVKSFKLFEQKFTLQIMMRNLENIYQKIQNL